MQYRQEYKYVASKQLLDLMNEHQTSVNRWQAVWNEQGSLLQSKISDSQSNLSLLTSYLQRESENPNGKTNSNSAKPTAVSLSVKLLLIVNIICSLLTTIAVINFIYIL